MQAHPPCVCLTQVASRQTQSTAPRYAVGVGCLPVDPNGSMRLRALFDSEPTSSGGASSPHVAAEASLDQVPGPSNTNPPRACLIAKTTAELAATHPHVASRARETFQKLLVVLADTVGQAQRAGDVPSDVDPQEAAALLLTTLRGIEALTEVQMPNATLSDAAQLALRAIGLNSTHH